MQKKIKVIHIIVDLGTGGAERQLIELLKKNSGHKLLILNNAGNFREELDFYKSVPKPENIFMGNLGYEEMQNTNNWYFWNLNNLGTKKFFH